MVDYQWQLKHAILVHDKMAVVKQPLDFLLFRLRLTRIGIDNYLNFCVLAHVRSIELQTDPLPNLSVARL